MRVCDSTQQHSIEPQQATWKDKKKMKKIEQVCSEKIAILQME